MAPEPRLSRRRLLALGAGGALVAAGGGLAATDPGVLRRTYRELTTDCGEDGALPPSGGAEMMTGSLRTEHLPAGRAAWRIALPAAGAEPRGVVLYLHGRGGHAADARRLLGLPDQPAALRARLAIAAIDGGDGYWHPRADGRDPLALLLDDFLPFVETRTGRLPRAVMGTSMGGYGAALAAQTRPGAFDAVVISSGALWRTAAEQQDAAPDAFDDADDFARHDVIAQASRLRGTPVRVDCGRGDPFLDGDKAFARATGATASFPAGCHDGGFWRRVAPAQMGWVVRALGL